MAEIVQHPRQFRQPLHTFYPSHITADPAPPQWIWDGLLMRGAVTLLAGEPKAGKSLLLQQLLSCSALGLPCLGRATERCRTFGFFCEDAQIWLERRQIAINQLIGAEPPDYELNYSWEARADRDCILADFAVNGRISMTDDWRAVVQYLKDEGTELVGIDTAGAVFNGSELDRRQVTQFLRVLAGLALELNACILLLVHPPKANPRGFSGSNAWLASARGGLNLGRPDDYDEALDVPADARVLRGLGSNYASRGRPLPFHWQGGAFVADDPEPPLVPTTELDKIELEYRLLAGLRRAVVRVHVPADVSASKSMPHLARYYAPDLARVPFNSLYAAQERLIERGQIVIVKVGSRLLIRPHDGPQYDGER